MVKMKFLQDLEFFISFDSVLVQFVKKEQKKIQYHWIKKCFIIFYNVVFSLELLPNLREWGANCQITISLILLCPSYYFVQHVTMSTLLFCSAHYCVYQIIVSITLICLYYYVQNITVSILLFCQTHHQHITVSFILLDPHLPQSVFVQISPVNMLHSYYAVLVKHMFHIKMVLFCCQS